MREARASISARARRNNSCSRRAFLKRLGLGSVGFGAAGIWPTLMGLGSCQSTVEPQPVQSTTVLDPLFGSSTSNASSATVPTHWKAFEFEVVTVDETGAIRKRKPGSAKAFKDNLGNGIELEMVKIPAGKFMMGSPEFEEDRIDAEGLQHEVTVPEFAMGRFAVTQAQYQVVMGNNPASFKGENYPVEQVSRNDAQMFCRKLSEKTGREYRLPSEAEWEYACRAGTTTPFHFGEVITSELANHNSDGRYIGLEERGLTTEVGSFPPNAFGLYDMHGNVWERCADQWHRNYYGAPTDGSVWSDAANDEERYVVRGGSWADLPDRCRSAFRLRFPSPWYRYSTYGFRVACVCT